MTAPQLALRITLAALCAPGSCPARGVARQHARIAARHTYRGAAARFAQLPVPCMAARLRSAAVLALLSVPLLAAGAPASFAEQADPSSARTCVAQAGSLADVVREQNAKNKVVVYSKSYCPYCAQVKGLFNKLNVDYKLFELDQIADGQDVQDALYDVTSRRTVPQVFVSGKFIGGCDDTTGMYQNGELKTVFETAGVSAEF